jgi:hypothetical protein
MIGYVKLDGLLAEHGIWLVRPPEPGSALETVR